MCRAPRCSYPKSLYKSLHVVWYRALQRGKRNELCEKWVIDDEQTDNYVSPWDTIPSKLHAKWRTAYPEKAALHNPRARRGCYGLHGLVEAPESMEIDGSIAGAADPEQEAIQRVLKRLLSNEASPQFFYPVPEDEVAYHTAVQQPICLSEISERAAAGQYASYAAFHKDVETLISSTHPRSYTWPPVLIPHERALLACARDSARASEPRSWARVAAACADSYLFNEDDTLYWICTCMLQKDLSDVRDELRAIGLAHLLTDQAPLAIGYEGDEAEEAAPEETEAADMEVVEQAEDDETGE